MKKLLIGVKRFHFFSWNYYLVSGNVWGSYLILFHTVFEAYPQTAKGHDSKEASAWYGSEI
jgi:hypothetical protein